MNDTMDSFRFKIGDKVKVRKDLKSGYYYSMRSGNSRIEVPVIQSMVTCGGEEYFICGMDSSWRNGMVYVIEDSDGHVLPYVWADEMFESPNCIFHGVI